MNLWDTEVADSLIIDQMRRSSDLALPVCRSE